MMSYSIGANVKLAPTQMRPDPYKRARSRQYKAKHGISDNKNYAYQSKDFLSSIIDEKYSKESNNNITPDGNFFYI